MGRPTESLKAILIGSGMWHGRPLLDQTVLSLQAVLKIAGLLFGQTKVQAGPQKLCIHLTTLFGMSAGQCLEICSPYLEETTKFLFGKKTYKEIGTVFQTLVAKLEPR